MTGAPAPGLGAEALERRLAADSSAPVCVGFSGGGDSLAALLLARTWCQRRGRQLIALTVDHRLQPQSAAWTAFAADTAARLGVGFRALGWDGEKPSRGLPAAARAARHRLLAVAARQAGARVVVLGHTADDAIEAELMRAWGANLGALREWSPSPVWPQGRGVFLLRPLLDVRRGGIRTWLAAQGERWIDDPANSDPSQARARARLALAGSGDPPPAPTDWGCTATLVEQLRSAGDGALRISRRLLRAPPDPAARRLLAAAALSAGGGARPPRGVRLDALAVRLASPGAVRATLCGARIIADDDDVLIVRDAGEAARGGLAPMALPAGEPVVWDGRFELIADRQGLVVRTLAGQAARLSPAQQRVLKAIPAPVRPGLPAVAEPGGGVTCPILAGGAVTLRDLVHERTRAACGAILKEPAT